jgi:phosphate transport system protein
MDKIKDEVLILGSMVEQSTLSSVAALAARNVDAARVIYQRDEQINDKRYAIENAVLVQIATQQPMAHDLRFLAAILEIINELERMGDYAKGIAKIVLLLRDAEISIPAQDFKEMAGLSVGMLHRGLSAFINEDTASAQRISADDDMVDRLYNQIYHKVVMEMIANPTMIDQANYLMWAAHNLERLADRVVNICERTLFISTGELLELDIKTEINARV